jgi:bacillithiol biosynthesis deacetylase BshB1
MSIELPDPSALPPRVDLLAFGPHPDDVELCAGGTLLKAAAAGQRIVIVDMTRGEAGTRGTPELRATEAQRAGALIGVVARENLGLPDAHVVSDLAAQEQVTAAIRKWRPRVVMGPCREDRHPDHLACAELLRRAYYGATIRHAPGGGLPAHRPDALVEYFGHLEPTPSFVVDVSAVWEARRELVACYGSQVTVEEEAPQTNISAPDFMRRVESRFAYWGSRIGASYGEPFRVDRMLPVDDIVGLFRKRGWAVL